MMCETCNQEKCICVWYSFCIQFKRGESTFEEVVDKRGVSEPDAFGSAWANLLIRYPGAVYITHAKV